MNLDIIKKLIYTTLMVLFILFIMAGIEINNCLAKMDLLENIDQT